MNRKQKKVLFRIILMVLLVVGGIALILWMTVSAWQFYSY